MKSKTYVDDLKNKTAADLAQELTAAKLDNTARIREVRKNIARIQTVMTQKAKVAE